MKLTQFLAMELWVGCHDPPNYSQRSIPAGFAFAVLTNHRLKIFEKKVPKKKVPKSKT